VVEAPVVEVPAVEAPVVEVPAVEVSAPLAPEPEPAVVEATPIDVAEIEPAPIAEAAVEIEPAPIAEAVAEIEPAPGQPELRSLAVAGQPLRYVEPEVEHALDELARAAREEILSANAPESAKRDTLGEQHWPWLTNMRKAWEPPADHPAPPNRPRWGRFRRND
jgi:ribonuclease E